MGRGRSVPPPRSPTSVHVVPSTVVVGAAVTREWAVRNSAGQCKGRGEVKVASAAAEGEGIFAWGAKSRNFCACDWRNASAFDLAAFSPPLSLLPQN